MNKKDNKEQLDKKTDLAQALRSNLTRRKKNKNNIINKSKENDHETKK